MVNPILPKAQASLVETGQPATREYYEFFRRLLQFILDSGADPGVIQSILDRLDELEQNGNSFAIQGLMSVDVFGTPQGGVVQIQLENDVLAPGNTYYYGTGPTGVKGWFTLASAMAEGVNIDLTVGLDGVTTISMPAAGDGSGARKPIQYNADALDTLGADAGFTYDPTVGVKLLENEGPASFRAITDTATLGPNLVTDGTFTGGLASWTAGAGWAAVAGTAQFTVGGAGTLSQNITVTSGRAYLVAWTQLHTVENNATITPSIGAASGMPVAFSVISTQACSRIIVAGASGSLAMTFTPATLNGGGAVRIDNVVVNEITNIGNVLTLENAAGTVTTEVRTFAPNTSAAYGRDSARSITTGASNSTFGALSGRSITTGSFNNFFGNSAGVATTAGGSNSAFGASALNANQTGSLNMAFGINALFANTTGSENVGIGSSALRQNISGSGNIGLGRDAGRFLVDGVTPLTNPENSIYIGNDARGLSDADSNSIVVGNTSMGQGANSAVWGNTSILNHYFSGSINLNQTNLGDLGAGVFRILNATTVPSVNPTNGVVIYSEAGAAKCRGSGGTITTFGPANPHCNKCGSDFVHEWENETRGYGYLAVCMNCYADGVRSFTRVKGSWPDPD